MKKSYLKYYVWLAGLALYLPFSTQASVDHGDAPAIYSRPDHVVNSSIILGNLIDAEVNAQYSPNADGDDINNQSDEDGLVGILPPLRVGDNAYSVTVKVKNNSNNNAYITAWIDFNKDGIFQYDEALNNNNVYVLPSTTENVTLTWDNSDNGNQFPIAESLIGDTILRIRLSTDRILRCGDENYQGGGSYEPTYLNSPDGEIEDYKLSIRGTLTNCFSIISADQSDPNTADNSDCVTITEIAGSNLPTPVLNYHFDEDYWSGISADVYDSSGNSLHGTANNGADTSNIGQINNSGSFNGSNQYVDAGDILNDVFGRNHSSFTITAWLKADTLSNAKTNHQTSNTFIAKASDSYNDNLEIGVNTDGTLHLYLDTKWNGNNGADTYKNFGNTGDISIGSWHFVAISYDGSTVKAYIDNKVYTDSNTWNRGSGNIDKASGSPFSIGASLHVNNYFDGNIDEVKVFDTALSDTDIQEIYTNESAGNNYNGTSRAIPVSSLPIGTSSAKFIQDNLIEWKSVWVNADVAEEPLVTIYNEIPEGTVFEEGSILCQSKGSSQTISDCQFEAPSESYPRGRIVWKGIISLEPNPQIDLGGKAVESVAQNAVIIQFASRAVANTSHTDNKTFFHPYSAWDYDQDGSINRLFYADAVDSDISSNDPFELTLPVQTHQPNIPESIKIPSLSQWGLLILSLLMSLAGLTLYRRHYR